MVISSTSAVQTSIQATSPGPAYPMSEISRPPGWRSRLGNPRPRQSPAGPRRGCRLPGHILADIKPYVTHRLTAEPGEKASAELAVSAPANFTSGNIVASAEP